MSKARLVITAVELEGRSQAEVARAYAVSPGWVSKLVARYRAEGEAAFQPRSRRPKTSPTAIGAGTVERIVRLRKQLAEQGLDAGPDTIAWHLAQHHRLRVSPATISRYLTAAGLITPQPRKRPKSSYIRFQAELPNECWQADFTHYRLADGTDCEILTWLDDHSRYALHVTAHRRITGPIVLNAFRETAGQHGIPASTLTDNGMVFTTRLSGGRGGRNALETELRRLGVVQKNSRPNHPNTCGKVERIQQTMKKWLRAQPEQPTTLAELQAYQARPKAGPIGDRNADTHHRVRHDRIDDTGAVSLRHHGRLHHIGLGREHARTPVIMLIQDLEIRVINAATGHLIRDLILDPTRDYQPRGIPPGPKPRNDETGRTRGFDPFPIS